MGQIERNGIKDMETFRGGPGQDPDRYKLSKVRERLDGGMRRGK